MCGIVVVSIAKLIVIDISQEQRTIAPADHCMSVSISVGVSIHIRATWRA